MNPPTEKKSHKLETCHEIYIIHGVRMRKRSHNSQKRKQKINPFLSITSDLF